MSNPESSTPSNQEKSPEEETEEVEQELANPNLYEDSMAEVTLNETRDGGHTADPFDRSDEYDEDVNLAAPPPITPDIPQVDPVRLLRENATASSFTDDVAEESK
uniref:Uncharacterized protein n=1 Tax=Caenorhabditis japonica TaxID=281687 RepID=A0A8R1HIA4_CAEJA